MTIGEQLRTARNAAGLSLAELGGRVGLSAATISRWETGRGRADADKLARIAEVLGVDSLVLREPMGAVVAPDEVGPPEPGAWREFDELDLDPVLQGALRSFLRLGYHGTTMRDVADAAGMSVPNIYHYHPSKQALLVALMDRTMDEFLRRCLAARADGDDAAARFRLLVECFALFHSHRRDLAFIGASEMRSIDEPDRRRIAQVRTDCQHLIDEELRALSARGRLTISRPEEAGRAVVTMLVGIAGWFQSGGPRPPADIAADHVEFATRIVGLQNIDVS